ncbi:23677_t:CDS:1, partial [Cetraspora pellucida]
STSGNDFQHHCKGMIRQQDKEAILFEDYSNVREKIKRKRVCYRYGSEDHIVYNCKEVKKCYRYNRSGHLARNCHIYDF